jgi:CRISPR-associated endonuclease Csn1
MAYAREEVGEYILGLDIGVASVGWAIIGQKDGKPDRLIRLGSRVFDAGMDEGSFEAGKENSRNAARRQARQARRMTERRVRRHAKLYRLLARAGLLPESEHPELLRGPPREERARYVHEQLKALDADLKKKHLRGKPGRHRLEQVWPYWLRGRALTEKLEPHELGRALYHLGQRRGFQSNRKELAALEEAEAEAAQEKPKGRKKQDAQEKDPRKKELGEVQAGINQLEQDMKAAGAETLGQYFATLDPHEKRIRQCSTSREMYKHEFDRIWAAQQPHHPDILTDDLRKKVHRAIFHQRPLKNQAFLIGWCEFEQKPRFRPRRRAPWGLLIAQRFRMLQQVNDLRIATPRNPKGDFLTPDQRDALLKRLEREGDLKFKAAKELLLPLGLPRSGRFNWESGGEERFLGNRTNAKMFTVFGDRWWQFSAADRDRIVEDVLSIQKAETLARRGKKAWGLDDAAARKFGRLVLEDGYCNLSRQALAKLVPLLQGSEDRKPLPYAKAVEQVYGKKECKPLDVLPPAALVYPHLRNPMVVRILSELRKVVNAVIRKYGKPAIVRVELARNLRRSKKQRTEGHCSTITGEHAIQPSHSGASESSEAGLRLGRRGACPRRSAG